MSETPKPTDSESLEYLWSCCAANGGNETVNEAFDIVNAALSDKAALEVRVAELEAEAKESDATFQWLENVRKLRYEENEKQRERIAELEEQVASLGGVVSDLEGERNQALREVRWLTEVVDQANDAMLLLRDMQRFDREEIRRLRELLRPFSRLSGVLVTDDIADEISRAAEALESESHA